MGSKQQQAAFEFYKGRLLEYQTSLNTAFNSQFSKATATNEGNLTTYRDVCSKLVMQGFNELAQLRAYFKDKVSSPEQAKVAAGILRTWARAMSAAIAVDPKWPTEGRKLAGEASAINSLIGYAREAISKKDAAYRDKVNDANAHEKGIFETVHDIVNIVTDVFAMDNDKNSFGSIKDQLQSQLSTFTEWLYVTFLCLANFVSPKHYTRAMYPALPAAWDFSANTGHGDQGLLRGGCARCKTKPTQKTTKKTAQKSTKK
jgi:hypothetical protein